MNERIKNLLINSGIICISLLITVLLGEASIRLLQKTNHIEKIDPQAHKANVKRNRRLNARLIRSDNPTLFLEYDPKNRHINNAGHRGKDIQIEKPINTFRIAVLGDSIAYGYNVPLGKTFTSLLQKKLNEKKNQTNTKYEVLNFAVSGYGTEAELELYKTKVSQYKPDLLLLTYTLNDPIPPDFLIRSVSSSRKSAKRFQKVASQSQFLAWAVQTYNKATKQSRVKTNYKRYYTNEKLWGKVQTSLGEFSNITQQQGVLFSAITFPLLLPFDDYPMQPYHDMINQEFQRNNIPFLDLLDIYKEFPVDKLKHNAEDTTHPNGFGHALAADNIYMFLEKNELLNAGNL